MNLLKSIFLYIPTKIQCKIYGHDWVNYGFDWSQFNNNIPNDVSIRHLLKCLHCKTKSHDDHFVDEVKCDVCNKWVRGPLQKHCKNINNESHLVLSIHES